MLPTVSAKDGTILTAATSESGWLGEKWGTTLLVGRSFACEAKRR